MSDHFEVNEVHPDALETGWWFRIEAPSDLPEFRIDEIPQVTSMKARPRPIIYICKDKRVVLVAETTTISISVEVLRLSEALETLNKKVRKGLINDD